MSMPACDAPIRLSLHAMLEANESVFESSDEDLAGKAGERRAFQPYHAQSVPHKENLEAQCCERAGSGTPVTTMMLRNIPNKYTQNTLLQEIDDEGMANAYDFFYLPMDVHNRSNVGYAFINFVTAQDAERFRSKFCEHRFQRFQSRKISSVCSAHVQGLDENLHHFSNRAVTQARNSQYRPIVLKGNVRVEFEDAVEEARSRACAAERKKAPVVRAPTAAAEPAAPRAAPWAAAGHPARTKKSAAPPRQPLEGLELAIRDLAHAFQYGQMQREAAAAAALPRCVQPPGLTQDAPAYVTLGKLASAQDPESAQDPYSPWKVRCGSEASTRDSLDFSRGCSDFSRASEEPL